MFNKIIISILLLNQIYDINSYWFSKNNKLNKNRNSVKRQLNSQISEPKYVRFYHIIYKNFIFRDLFILNL